MSRNGEEKKQSQAKPRRGEMRSDKMHVHVPACGTAKASGTSLTSCQCCTTCIHAVLKVPTILYLLPGTVARWYRQYGK